MKDLTLLSCSFNTPTMTETMIKSWVHHNGKESEILIIENSTNEDTVKILDNNNISYIRNEGGKHSQSVDIAIQECKTKYALLVDTDIIHQLAFCDIYNLMKDKYVLGGTVCGSRGGHLLYDRIHPWFMYIDIDIIKKREIKYHDQDRIDRTQSNGFYESIPIAKRSGSYMYDVGATFYEDVYKNCGFMVANVPAIENWYKHYEGSSWRGNLIEWKDIYNRDMIEYKKEIDKYKEVDIRR